MPYMAVTVWIAQAVLYLTPAPPVLDFGNLSVGSRNTQSVYLNNTGTGDVTISEVSAVGPGFSVSGPTLPVTIGPGRSTGFQVTFAPERAGRATGTITVLGTAAQVEVGLAGTGAESHSVSLTWTASASPGVIGYNILRGTRQGGPYANLNSSPVPDTTYVDWNVQAGETYYYVCTAVDSVNRESGYSNEAQATIPPDRAVRRDDGAIRTPGRRGAYR